MASQVTAWEFCLVADRHSGVGVATTLLQLGMFGTLGAAKVYFLAKLSPLDLSSVKRSPPVNFTLLVMSYDA
jgi:hypothetical protein